MKNRSSGDRLRVAARRFQCTAIVAPEWWYDAASSSMGKVEGGGVFFIEWHENWINLSVYIETTWSRHYIVIFYNPSFCVYTVDGWLET